MDLPKPVLWLAITPKTKADKENLGQGLQQLMAEDPTIRVTVDRQTGQASIGGVGELHLEIIVDRLRREFNVEASVGAPQIAYKEMLTRKAEGEGRYVRHAGDRGQYGHAKIRVSPGEPGTGYIFQSAIVTGSIPKEFVESIDTGIRDALKSGVLAGYPVEDVRVELVDGSYHDVDSSVLAFQIAGAMAFQDAAMKGEPVLLEPVMRVELAVPTTDAGDVIGDLASRRGRIQSQRDCEDVQIISALVPLSGLFGYAAALRSDTQGRASSSMYFDRYEPFRGDSDDGDRDSVVGAPRKPTPKVNASAVALPEPDDSVFETGAPTVRPSSFNGT